MSNPIVVTVCMARPVNRGSLNSAHIHGTHVPVEEPSTASQPDSCTAAKTASSFDNIVGAREQRRGDVETKQTCSFQIDRKFELGRLQNRKLGGLGTFED